MTCFLKTKSRISVFTLFIAINKAAIAQGTVTSQGCGSVAGGRDVKIEGNIICPMSKEQQQNMLQDFYDLSKKSYEEYNKSVQTTEIEKLKKEKFYAEGRYSIVNPDDASTRQLAEQADAAIKSGDRNRATALLKQLKQLHFIAVNQLKAIIDIHMFNAAEASSAQGAAAMIDRQFSEAAEFFRQAASFVYPEHIEEYAIYLTRQANALFKQGDEQKDRIALEKSIEVYRKIINDPQIKQNKIYIARMKNSIAISLFKIGEREYNNEKIKQSIDTYIEVLNVSRREVNALDWAETQNNLGSAYLLVGQRTGNISYLEKASSAFRAALEERERQAVPLDWANSQNNLGSVLIAIGDYKRDSSILNEAIDILKEALKVRAEWKGRENIPGDMSFAWGTTQSQIGMAYERLGEIKHDSSAIMKSIDAFNETLTVWKEDILPVYWAATQTNLGGAYLFLGRWKKDVFLIEKAVEADRASLRKRPRSEYPIQWAISQSNLGTSLFELGLNKNNHNNIKESVEALNAALKVFTPQYNARNNEIIRRKREEALKQLTKMQMKEKPKLNTPTSERRSPALPYRRH